MQKPVLVSVPVPLVSTVTKGRLEFRIIYGANCSSGERLLAFWATCFLSLLQKSHLMTKPTKWSVHPAKTQISLGIHPVWSESLLWARWVAKDPRFPHADSEDSDQTGRMPRLIWVFAGHTFHFVGFVVLRLKCFSDYFRPYSSSDKHCSGIVVYRYDGCDCCSNSVPDHCLLYQEE